MPVIPVELLSQIIYQYVLGIRFRNVLKLRLVSKFFDAEVILALLETIKYRPRVSINWYPLTRHLVQIRIQQSSGTDTSSFHHVRKAIEASALEFPGHSDREKCCAKYADQHAYCISPERVLHSLARPHGDQSRPGEHYASHVKLHVAILADASDLVARFWNEDVFDRCGWEKWRNLAIQVDSEEALEFLLGLPTARDWHKDNLGRVISTPIVLCARYGRLAMANALIEHPDHYNGETPMCIQYVMNEAAANGHIDLLKYFIGVVRMDPIRRAATTPSASPVHELIKGAFLKAVDAGQIQVVTEMLSEEFKTKYEVDIAGDVRHIEAALTGAARHSHLKIARLILEQAGVDFPRIRPYATPVAAALFTGNVEIAELLHAFGMPLGAWLCNMAAQAGQVASLRWLVSKRPEREVGILPISIARAVMRGYVPMVEYIKKELCVLAPDPDDGTMDLKEEDMHEGQPRIFLDDPILTATVNGQDHMVDVLLRLGYERKRTPPTAAGRFADGTYPLSKDKLTCVRAFEDPENGTNVQMWARKIPDDFLNIRGRRIRMF